MDRPRLIVEEQIPLEKKTNPDQTVELSVVVPVSDRHDNVRDLYLQYARALSADGHSYEFIFILDGPNPEVIQTLRHLKKEHPEIRIITLNRSFGEATALSVGFNRSRAPVIVTLSSYFQVEPREVQRLLRKLSEGGDDMVISWRFPRIDSFFNRIQAWVFQKLTRMFTGMRYHDISCSMRVMKRKVAEEIHLYGDLHRFFPLLAYQRGFKVEEVRVQQSPEDVKRRIYTPGLYLRRLLDILTLIFIFKFTKKPLRFFGLIGSGLFGGGALILAYLSVYRILGFGPIAGRPLLILGVLLMVLGAQLFSIGLLGEIIIFTHARDVKEYQIKEILE
jgi:glycosyltransferase involved in cell wall biosynthesis